MRRAVNHTSPAAISASVNTRSHTRTSSTLPCNSNTHSSRLQVTAHPHPAAGGPHSGHRSRAGKDTVHVQPQLRSAVRARVIQAHQMRPHPPRPAPGHQ